MADWRVYGGWWSGFFCVFYRMTLTEEPCYQAPLHDNGPEKPHKWDINDSTLPMVSKKV